MVLELVSEPPRQSAFRRSLIAGSVLLAVVVNLAAALLLHGTVGEGPVALDTREWLASRDMALPAAILGSVLSLLVSVSAYLISLDSRQLRRPRVLLLGLLSSFVFVLLVPILGVLHIPLENGVVLGVSLGAALVGAGILMMAEWAVGRSLAGGAALLAAGRSGGTVFWSSMALAFSPSNAVARRALGLGYANSQRLEEAYPHLMLALQKGQRTAPMLRALGDIAEKAGQDEVALSYFQELAGILPGDGKILEYRIRLLRRLGRLIEARELLEALGTPPPEPWRGIRLELLYELHDLEALMDEARLLEKEHGPPFVAARAVLGNLLLLEPGHEKILREVQRLAEQAGDSQVLLEMLERLISLRPDDATLVRKAREEYRRVGQGPRAQELLFELARLNQATVEERLELASLYAQRGEEAALLEHLLSMEGEPLRTARGCALLVRHYYESGRHNEALAEAQKGRDQGYLVGLAEEEVARIENQIKSQALNQALEQFGREVREHPENFDLQIAFMEKLTETGSTDRVVLHAEDLLGRQGFQLQSRLEEALEEMAAKAPQGRSGRLIEYVGDLRLRAQDGDGALAHYRHASTLSLHPDKALRQLTQRILATLPDHGTSQLVLAELELKLGDARASLRHIDAALELGMDLDADPQLRLIEFHACRLTGSHGRALQVAQPMLEKAPWDEDLEFQLQVGDLYLSQGHYEKAVTHLEKLFDKKPEDMAVRSRLRQATERRKVARIERLKTELTACPNSPNLLEELGDMLLADNKLEDAVVAFQKAAHFGADYRTARAKLGLTLCRKGLHEEAEEAYGETEINPGLPEEELGTIKALFYEGGLLMEQDRESDRALRLYKRISKVDMGYRDILARIERLSRSQKRRQVL
jgi:tetratricopeptide (TPR) repeat protein